MSIHSIQVRLVMTHLESCTHVNTYHTSTVGDATLVSKELLVLLNAYGFLQTFTVACVAPMSVLPLRTCVVLGLSQAISELYLGPWKCVIVRPGNHL
jgi:hypothetical protein